MPIDLSQTAFGEFVALVFDSPAPYAGK